MEDEKKKMSNEVAATKRQPLRIRIRESKAAGGDVADSRSHGNKFITI